MVLTMNLLYEHCLMNITPNVHAMIVAAGRGSRFGASIAKQYTNCKTRPCYSIVWHGLLVVLY